MLASFACIGLNRRLSQLFSIEDVSRDFPSFIGFMEGGREGREGVEKLSKVCAFNRAVV